MLRDRIARVVNRDASPSEASMMTYIAVWFVLSRAACRGRRLNERRRHEERHSSGCGYLTVSDDRGRILAETTSDSAPFAALLADVPTTHDSTLYMLLGDWFAWLALAVLAFALVQGVRPQINEPDARPSNGGCRARPRFGSNNCGRQAYRRPPGTDRARQIN
jgi:hypothetical protein